MSWHYRVLRHPDGWYGLHEVYCDASGQPHSYTAEPILVANDDEGVEGITKALEMAFKDARERPVLDAATITKRPVT